MRIKRTTVVAATVGAGVLLVVTGALDKFFLRTTGTVVRREGPRR